MVSWPGVRAFPVPFDYSGYNETMLWHRRNDNDPGHVWLRYMLSEASNELAGEMLNIDQTAQLK
jgi:hypothetical protein